MEIEKLLPCPMCAGEGEAACLRIGEDAVASWVRCLSCGLRTAEIEDAYSDLPSAIAAWNTRAPAELTGWRDIETAPKDGSLIDIWIAGCRETDVRFGRPEHSCGEYGRYCDSCPSYDGWVSSHCEHYLTGESGLYDDEPTHWMYPPAPPGTTRAPADLRSAVEAEAIERCAKVAEGERVDADATQSPTDYAYNLSCEHIAKAIRTLAPTKGD